MDQTKQGHDMDVLRETTALRDFYMQQGYEPRHALREAADTVALRYGIQKAGQAAPAPAQEPAAQAQAEPQPTSDLERKTEMASRQPPKTPGSRNDGQSDVNTLPESEFDKLSDEDLARARGDYL